MTWESETPLKTIPRHTHCSAPVSKELSCRGAEGGNSADVIDSAFVESFYDCYRVAMLGLYSLTDSRVSGWVGEQGELYKIYFQDQYRVCERRCPLYCPWGLHIIGLCISIRFFLLFLSLCFHRGWRIYLYRPSVLLFNTIAGLIDFSTVHSAQRGCGCVIWRELNSIDHSWE